MPIGPAAPAAGAPRVPGLLSRALEAAWQRGVLPPPVLQSGALIDWAAAREGARPDDGSWREALDLLTGDLRDSAALNALGRTIAHGQLTGMLRQRIRAEATWRRHPEMLAVPVAAPVIIFGHMRSGTTRLHRLLACDPRFAYTRLHESLWPVATGPRAIASAAAVRAFLAACNPPLRNIHPTGPRAPEEEFGLHAFSFHGAMFEAQWTLPRFARWSEQRNLDDAYREFRALVQLLRWKRGDRPDRVQLLKAPQFMQEPDALLKAFPDARILWIERDEKEVVPSSASLVWHQQRVQSDHADPLSVGQEWLRKTRLRQARASEALRLRPSVPLLRISYQAMNADWRAELTRIYDFLGFELPPRIAEAMARVATGSAHKGHCYSLEQFDLTEALAGDRENGGRGKD